MVVDVVEVVIVAVIILGIPTWVVLHENIVWLLRPLMLLSLNEGIDVACD